MAPDTPELRQRVIAEARKWLGTPFHAGANAPGVGVACGPILISVYGCCGFEVPPLPNLSAWPIDWHLHTQEERYLSIIRQFTREVLVPLPADIAMFSLGRNGKGQPLPYAHSGIVVEWPMVIHTMWGRGTELADASQPPLGKQNRAIKFLSPFQSL